MTLKNFSSYLDTAVSGINLASALGVIGLQKRSNAFERSLPALGAFGLGLSVGAGLGLLFAPRSGSSLRDDLGRKVNRLATNIKKTADQVESSAKPQLRSDLAEITGVNGH